jgi:tellurite resistance-related uncharacterized protein
MIRSIVRFHADEAGDWVAELSCFHNQHVRHRPPFQDRVWVLDLAGREGRVGSPIDCPLCDRAEFPEGLTIVGRAGPWDCDSLPAGLLRAHRIAEGRWGRLRVHEGAVELQFEPGDGPDVAPLQVEAGGHQAIPPGAPHHVVLTGAVRLEIEFWGRQDATWPGR